MKSFLLDCVGPIGLIAVGLYAIFSGVSNLIVF